MLLSTDSRLQYILSLLKNQFSSIEPNESNLLALLQNNDNVERFLEREECLLLEVYLDEPSVDDGVHPIKITNTLTYRPHKLHLFLLKLQPTIHISASNKFIQIGSLEKSANSAQQLLLLIHLIYKPLLSQEQGESHKKLLAMLTELQMGLQTYLKSKMRPGASAQQNGTASQYFLTPQEEMRQYEYLDDDRSMRLNEIFHDNSVCEAFEHLVDQELDGILKSSFFDDVKTMTDALWEMDPEPYSESRMKHLLSVMASELGLFVQRKLNNLNVWSDSFLTVKKQFTYALDICYEWIRMTEEATTVDWVQDPTHPWRGQKHMDQNLVRLSQRLEHILHLRNSYEEVRQNLSLGGSKTSEQTSNGDSNNISDSTEVLVSQSDSKTIQEAIQNFAQIDVLDLSNKESEKKYQQAAQFFERALVPLEKRISEKLKTRLQQYISKPQLLILEFQRNKALIQRRNIQAELSQERTTLMGQVRSHVNTLKNRFEDLQYDDFKSTANERFVGRTTSRTVAPLLFAKNIENQMKVMKTTVDTFLKDLVDVTLLKDMETFLLTLREFINKQFKKWCEEMEDEGDLSLTGKSLIKMVKVEGQDYKELQVNYSERLILLMREVRQFSLIGFAVPPHLKRAAQEAEIFYTQAVTLKQIARYYNTVHTQIIDSHSQMLMKAAGYFEKVIFEFDKSRKTWNPERGSVDISDLKKAADSFATEHQKLTKLHRQVSDKVVELMDISLLQERTKWEECFIEIRKIFNFVDSQGYDGTDLWKSHWDYQIYKALEHQYQLGLETLNDVSLTEMNIEIVFRDHRLQFVPPLEDIKDRYYRKLREYIAFPTSFPGVGNTGIFKFMAQNNYKSLKVVYRKSTKLFATLERFLNSFEKRIILGQVDDLENMVSENLSDISHWEINFRMLKQKGKEMERLPNVQKIDCFNVSTERIKATIEEHLQKLGDILVKTLRESAEKHLKSIEAFVDKARERLDQDPHSITEIGEAHEYTQQLNVDKHAIFLEFQEFEKKNRLLRGVAGTNIDSTRIKAKWQDFDDTLAAHDKYLADKTTELRQKVDDKMKGFKNKLARFTAHWNEFKPKSLEFASSDQTLREVKFIKEKQEEFAQLEREAQDITKECQYFGLKQQKLNDLDVGEDISRMYKIWHTYEEYMGELDKFLKASWITFKKERLGDEFEDFITKWINNLKNIEKNALTLHIREELDNQTQLRDYISFLYGDGWTTEHWMFLFNMLGIRDKTYETITFGDLLGKAPLILEKIGAIKELNARALGEETLRKALQELKLWESSTDFNLFEHEQQASRGVSVTPLIREWKEIRTEVGDNQSLLQSLKDSKFVDLFAVEVRAWENKLQTLDEFLDQLNKIQLKWVYLSPIFNRGALPSHQHLFQKLDTSFRSVMLDIRDDPRVLQLAKRPLKTTLKIIFDQLQTCQKALNQYLEEKRSSFPRFYFIGDDDLLQILGQSQNPEIIQNHLKKLFQGIHTVQFNEDFSQIVAMCSSAGEIVSLQAPVTVTERVEEWLSDLDSEMKHTLERLLVQCHAAEDFDIDAYPSQVLCLSEYISFTVQCQEAITNKSLPTLHANLRSTLADYTSMESKDNNLQELKIKALILDLIHNIDVVQQLIDSDIQNESDWMWQKQLRFELNEEKKAIAKMCDAQFDYTYEYQGNVAKLVHTPLTDKCYLTLTQGMHLGYGGNPYGPAGTGKTESVKALGSLLGRQTLVQNCDEGIDFQSMGRIFIGLVKCGAWGCFDEFNRLKEDQLSAVSQQIQVIQHAIKEGKDTPVDLLDTKVLVNPNAGIFVTLNPAGKKYGGRSKLPDNLKQLFRSVAMSKPDLDLIAEVILYSEGFTNARELGRKLVSIYQLCKQLLSPQQHYDWGLRAMKTVLSIGGSLIKRERASTASRELSKEVESEIIIKSLRVNTISKLTYNDAILFKDIVNDVFPGIDTPDIVYETVEEAVRSVLIDWNLSPIDSQIQKILQFYEACNQRMGVVICGSSGSGKTTVWKVLQEAFMRMDQQMRVYVVNPKSIPRQQLLGHMDPDTREWYEGIITSNARQIIQEPLEVRSWIVCDGDIDPEWIESLNSVLDDNHLLTMPTGERIKFGDNVNFIFETHTLKFASPATVSRMGMIFLSEQDVEINSLVSSWIEEQPEECRAALLKWMNAYFFQVLEALFKINDLVVETTQMGLVKSALSQLHAVSTKGQFVVGLIRGLGSYLKMETRGNFALQIFKICEEKPIDIQHPLDCKFSTDISQFVPYAPDTTEKITYDELFDHPMVKTVAVQRTMDIIEPWLKRSEPFILVGPEGCGKSMILRNAFRQMKSVQTAVIHCNAQTNAANIISKLEQSCALFTSKDGKVLRPKDGERLVLYIKDVNLPKPDKYGTTQLVSFLQQIVTYNGYYGSDLEMIKLEGVQIVCTMNPPSTVGRHPLTTRFTSVVRVCYVTYPDHAQLQTIYSEFVQAVFQKLFASHPVWNNPANQNVVVLALLGMYEKITQKFTRNAQAHYIFTPRDLTAWILGIAKYQFEDDATAALLLDIFFYEARRLFGDLLVDDTSYDVIERSVMRHFEKLSYDNDVSKTIFTTFISTDTGKKKCLSKIGVTDYATVIKEGLKRYEREHRKLRVLFMTEIVLYIAQIERVLSQDRGSLLLVGRPGIGRSNLVQLVSHMLNIELFSPKMALRYNLKQFKADLKQVCTIAGSEGKPICFFLEDHQISNPTFFEYINSLLCAGEVTGIFTPEELDPLLAPLRDEAAKDAEFGGGSLYSYFTFRVKKNLRVALSMDPTNKKFGVLCQSNPAIFNECTIIWKTDWTKSGTASVPKLMIGAPILKKIAFPPKQMILCFVKIHQSLQQEDVTPLHFLRFLDSFKSTFVEKLNAKIGEQNRLKQGLSKLNEAAQKVDILKKNANEKKILLAQKQAETDKNMKLIERNMNLAVKQKEQIQEVQSKINAEESKLKGKQDVINQKLSTVKPILDSAKEAVGMLDSRSLNYIRSLPNPPKPVEHVLEAVLTYMGNSQIDWNSMKKFLGTRGVVQSILNFDARSVKRPVVERVKQVIDEHPDSFEDSNIARVSKEAGALAKWVVANIKYTEILKTVAPLEDELRELRKIGDEYKVQLQKYDSELQQLNYKTKALQDAFAQNTAEAAQLQVGLEEAEKTLHAAENLLNKLGGEKIRWEGQVKEASEIIRNLPKHVLIASAFVTYLGGKPEDVRHKYIESWKEFLKVDHFDLKEFMSTESEMLKYKAEGLPGDSLSQENAIIMLNSEFPLIIDPAQQATRWLLKHMEGGMVEVTNTQDEKFNNTLELSVRFGKVLIIQEIDKIDAILFPILRKELFVQGPRKSVTIGDKLVDYNDEFKLFLVTRNADIRLSPDSAPWVSEVNFTVTRSGLEGQLLGLTIQHENPELELQKSNLLQKEEDDKIKLADLEKSLLEQLANSKGNLLENVELIEQLNRIKVSSMQIMTALEKSSELKHTLDEQRDGYRAFAKCGSTIFFLIRDLKQINPMYQFSLSTFLKLFQRALSHHEVSSNESQKDLAVRIALLTELLQKIVFGYLSRSLFKADTLLFGTHMVHGLYRDTINEDEWNFFIGKLYSAQGENTGRQTVPIWVPPNRRSAFVDFVGSLPNLASSLDLSNESIWPAWLFSEDCTKTPYSVTKKLSAFQKLIMVQVFRPDQLYNVMDAYVCQALGLQSTAPTPLSLESVYRKETSPLEPILLITTPGADPSVELEEMASKTVGEKKFHQIAMGQGQAEIAIQLLRQCSENGEWLCLKNLHLVVAWLPDLEKEFSMLKPHENFRLWLTTEIHDSFPPILLQQSLKITFESPPGLKQNLMRTMSGWNNDFMHDSTNNPTARSKLYFILSWFHAIVQERRSYIPQGWTKFYEFSTADLRSATDVIEASIRKDSIDWNTIHGLLENAIYGGRIDNHYDLRILFTYLKKYFNQQMLTSPSSQLARGVKIAQSTEYEDYVRTVEQLPNHDALSDFGLPANANRVVMINKSNRLISHLKQLSLHSLAGSDGSAKLLKDQWADRLSPVIEFWKKMIESNAKLVENTPFTGQVTEKYLSSPLAAFIYLEHENARALCRSVDNALRDIEQVMNGTLLETPIIQANVAAMLKDEVPTKWEDEWEGPTDLRKWLTQLVEKAGHVLRLFQEDRYYENESINLRYFFNPHVFLNALKQQTARATGQALDNLVYLTSQWKGSSDANILDDIPCVKVTITGMLLQGCGFDGATLTDLSPDAATMQPLPPCEIAWVTKENQQKYIQNVQYDQELAVPLYLTPSREEQVVELHLPCNGNTEKYILSAVSAFINES
uniref:Cytoplasmic dynein 2 heavy chain 1 n=1 Tax=Percolomonas cosmopolitus TaxID=63605 RepID=A0A7S1KS08_9EUKA|mmetsp:Transcript_7134/g.26705  ORF Transcript_7134/g.26705 Transcript_7134/m.26705 type:complete len:4292 (+) Transcript_7134:174-13049(+)|eukprot:CAMPEP_0117437286 /NCGR_PEP_ID=MMETSP0759-20121206/1445_1 /TAXON_ID=63605 /ORGANISM="Percolomonas cosmopolitus, Strain WS" /LENGTH=4291 /DNA_ID=CAMNT_0005228913 /DNA_START=126 /DNA_END=13001 /DNA_ORIENTATION=+